MNTRHFIITQFAAILIGIYIHIEAYGVAAYMAVSIMFCWADEIVKAIKNKNKN